MPHERWYVSNHRQLGCRVNTVSRLRKFRITAPLGRRNHRWPVDSAHTKGQWYRKLFMTLRLAATSTKFMVYVLQDQNSWLSHRQVQFNNEYQLQIYIVAYVIVIYRWEFIEICYTSHEYIYLYRHEYTCECCIYFNNPYQVHTRKTLMFKVIMYVHYKCRNLHSYINDMWLENRLSV